MSRTMKTKMLLGRGLLALGFIGVGCDDVASNTGDGGPVATRTAALEETSGGPDDAPVLDCELPDGPWSRGAILGMEELIEVAALLRESCPHFDLDDGSPPHAQPKIWTEAKVPSTPETFCTTGQPPLPISVGDLPGRVEEMAIVEARFESDVDLTDRLETFRESELVDPRSIEALEGVDGTWRPVIDGDAPAADGEE